MVDDYYDDENMFRLINLNAMHLNEGKAYKMIMKGCIY